MDQVTKKKVLDEALNALENELSKVSTDESNLQEDNVKIKIVVEA